MMAGEALPVRLCRLLLGVLALVAVARQFFEEAWLPEFSAANFFSYFTILSNIAAGTLLIRLGVAPRRGGARLIEWVRGGMTVYMATTGVVFAVLLDNGELGLTLPWVNTVMHRIIPIVLFLDWVLVRPRARVAYWRAVTWVAVPLLYAVYALARGAITGWFPYPFLRPEQVGGVAGVALHLSGMAGGILVASLLVAWLGNVRAPDTAARLSRTEATA